jgi:acetyl-CoA carboxylase biotin carboxyl carrier protein
MSGRPGKDRPAKPKDPAASDVPRSPNPFDIDTVQALIGLMSEHDLSEIELREANRRIRLRRGTQLNAVSAPMAFHPTPTPTAAAGPPKADSTPTAPAKKLIEIKSPTPGTFYASPSPDAQPFVRAGSKVTPTTVVCLIEAMKIFNEITADCTGVIAEILAENQQPVEYGQVLFRVDPTG